MSEREQLGAGRLPKSQETGGTKRREKKEKRRRGAVKSVFLIRSPGSEEGKTKDQKLVPKEGKENGKDREKRGGKKGGNKILSIRGYKVSTRSQGTTKVKTSVKGETRNTAPGEERHRKVD